MSRGSTLEEQRKVLSMVCAEPTSDWYVLRLPDGRYAALWAQGLMIEHGSAIAAGDYEDSCALIGSSKQEVLKYIREADADENDPLK